ncbi:MAG: hypothetical protein QN158_07585 [Armatimonadota bacterium]|nr:hypothetical protein [Armatimonadota bacterium]MDR7502076.1 hypothetical protein [Armatimonadota bacterium]MDR7585439.1 hypothetical protein [Armatimonadota bacterium]
MKDLYASLADERACPDQMTAPAGLGSGFVDGCTAWSARGSAEKNEARRCYLKHIAGRAGLALPAALRLEPDFSQLPARGWIGFEVAFTLETPWYSKDDRPFHVLDNPARKDRVFGVPFMAAASWKGLLRWACRMRNLDPGHIRHLFGNEKGKDEDFQRGALAFYPTWFDCLGFEVINPHSRTTRAGTQPIYYEVVPPEARGVLRLLYAPLPGMEENPQRSGALLGLLKATDDLLRKYGISAKRTVGWGTARPELWKAYRKGEATVQKQTVSDFVNSFSSWLGGNA